MNNILAVKVDSVGDLIVAGGWLMIPLAILLVVGFYKFFERLTVLRRSDDRSSRFLNEIKDLVGQNKIDRALSICRTRDTPLARMVAAGIQRLDRSQSDIQLAIENIANLEVANLEKGVSFLSTIAGGAPMIGFLGTVIGMVEAFIDLSQAGGAVDMAILSSGIYTAMITTVAGLLVGIPAYFGHNYLESRIDRMVFELESNSIAFLDIVNQER
jgi:biopolymer transport protein ExbB